MITRLSHATVWVDDQDAALDFYTTKLGMEVRMDITQEGFRWLTVGPPDQKDLALVLMDINNGPLDDAAAEALRGLLRAGAMGVGVLATDDCHAAYEQLRGRGVEFLMAPEERPYGVEATFRDNSGNWFSLTEERG